ncbi:MAG: hypothetical protein KIT17_15040 [Rubrivivax sp.]|nr:hypothetical protein [Rubrivivax sp.]
MRGPGLWRCAACALLAMGLVVLADGAAREAVGALRQAVAPAGLADPCALALVALYTLLMALPFVPGIELGLALMLLLGTEGVVAVYLATQLALLLSFLAGCCLRASGSRCLAALQARARARLPAVLHRVIAHRHLSLALALNLPGNAALGGAGGIGLIAGASGHFVLWRYGLTVALATTPLPLVMLCGAWR